MVIFVGGGFTEAEVKNMRKSDVVRTVPWMYPSASVRAKGKGPPPSKVVLRQARESLIEHGLVPGEKLPAERGIWSYGEDDSHAEQRPKL